MEKLISIVVPVYNAEKYIGETLHSIVRQTYKNFEVLVVNDGSIDNSADIIKAFADKDSRINLINQVNKGLSGARNTGMAQAKGEYIAIIDSDDLMLPNKIASQYAWLESHPEYDITYSNLYYFVDKKDGIYLYSMPHPSGQIYQEILEYGTFINPNTVFFRKKLYEKLGGFEEGMRRTEDLDYWLTLAYNKVGFLYQPEYLTLYRLRKDSISADSIPVYQTTLEVFEKQLNRKGNEEYNSIITAQIKKAKTRLALAHLRKGNKFIDRLYKLLKGLKFKTHFKSIHNSEVENFLLLVTSGN
ncbi:MAG: glycosyltransferase [Patescibacteria group bacterium]